MIYGSSMPVPEPITGKATSMALGVVQGAATEATKDLERSVAKIIGYTVNTRKKCKNAQLAVKTLVDCKNTLLGKKERAPGFTLNEQASGWIEDVEVLQQEINNIVDRSLWNPFKRHSIGWKSAWADRRAEKLMNQYQMFFQMATDDKLFVPATPKPLELCDLPATEPNKYTGRAETLAEIISSVDDANHHLIDVFGTGGIGKTTMLADVAREVGKRTEGSNRFDRVVYVKVGRQQDIGNIGVQIAPQLGVQLANEESPGPGLINKLRLEWHRRVLLILDDVWTEIDLLKIGLGSYKDFPGVKVLIGTRRTDLRHTWSADAKIPINFLSDEDSWDLFKAKAKLREDDINKIGDNVAKAVKDECGGLPLALAIIGSALSVKRERGQWENALNYLKLSDPKYLPNVEEKLYRCIQYSYDNLKDTERQLVFQLCCLFPEGHEILVEDLTRYLIGEHETESYTCLQKTIDTESIITGLEDFCLIQRPGTFRTVKMHDVVRDVAVFIANEKKITFINCGASHHTKLPDEHFKKVERMSVMRSRINEVPDQLDCPELCMLLLRENQHIKLTRYFFKKLKKLVVLDISDSSISSLPSSVEYLSNLRTLCLNRCSNLCSVDIIKKLYNLRVLSLRDCKITSLPNRMNSLQYLRVLDLKSLRGLKVSVELLSDLRQLEELHLDTMSLSVAHLIEIAKLKHLKELELCIPDVSIFYSSQIPTGLISNWQNFFVYSSELLQVSRSYKRSLHIKGAIVISAWVKLLVAATEDLTFDECFPNWLNLATPVGGNKFQNTKVIRLIQCNSIKCLYPTNHAGDCCFTNLEEIYLTDLENLLHVSEGNASGSFQKVKRIHMKNCGKVKCVMPYGLLLNVHCGLKEITIIECKMVQTIFQFHPTDALLLQNLRTIQLCNLRELTSICQGTPPEGTFANLKELVVEGCGDSLKSLFTPHLTTLFTSLQKLIVEGNTGLEEIISDNGTPLERKATNNNNNIIAFPRVSHMSLLNLDQLQSFHKVGETITSLEWPMLSYLRIGGCSRLVNLPRAIISTPNLEEIELASIEDENWYKNLRWDGTTRQQLHCEIRTSTSGI